MQEADRTAPPTADAATPADPATTLLQRLEAATGRDAVLYYSAWQQWPGPSPGVAARLALDDSDKTALMAVCRGLGDGRGLDLLLHTPGGDLAASESLISFLRARFGQDIRAVVPQIAMSAGTILACACREIVMGPYSNIGPFDPQIGGTLPAHAVVEEFAAAAAEIDIEPARAALWEPILRKYPIGLVSKARRAIEMADDVVSAALGSGMFRDDPDAEAKIDRIVKTLGSYAITKMHGRHIERSTARDLGLAVTDLEADPAVEDAVLALHFHVLDEFESGRTLKLIQSRNVRRAVRHDDPSGG